MKITRFALLHILVLTMSSLVYARTEGCGVTTYFREIDSGNSSSRFLVGKFPLNPDEGEVTKFFRHEESGVNVSVGVQIFTSAFKDKPKMIRVAMSFSGKSGDTFEMIDGAQAESIYDRHWKWLSVSDNIKVANRIYTFTVSCGREVKRPGR